jgi:hypothetical protein
MKRAIDLHTSNELIDMVLSNCAETEFGATPLTEGAKNFRREWNNEILALCKSLPDSTQTDALLFFMNHSAVPFGDGIDFFRTYYSPTWSIIYWLSQLRSSSHKLTDQDIRNAKAAHSMAMFLHAVDDHLVDGELPVSHLAILLRSQAWVIMSQAMQRLAAGIRGGEHIVCQLIDDYYASIRDGRKVQSVDEFCDLFRKQMATGMVAPVLLAKKLSANRDFADALQYGYGCFGVAWRLIDDIKDIESDMRTGAHSVIYYHLPKDLRKLWHTPAPGAGQNEDRASTAPIFEHLFDNRIIEHVKCRICSEIEKAAAIAADHNMSGWAEELNCLLAPLKS